LAEAFVRLFELTLVFAPYPNLNASKYAPQKFPVTKMAVMANEEDEAINLILSKLWKAEGINPLINPLCARVKDATAAGFVSISTNSITSVDLARFLKDDGWTKFEQYDEMFKSAQVA
jgi:hypothetical protein